MKRRPFLNSLAAAGLLTSTPLPLLSKNLTKEQDPLFKISISQWTFHRAIFGDARNDYNWFIKTLHNDPDAVLKGPMDPRDIVVEARKLGVEAVDLVNILQFGHGKDKPWLQEFKRRAKQEGVEIVCMMCDELGLIGAKAAADRQKAVELHESWMETAAFLGCSQFRVNAYGQGSYLEQLQQCAESLQILADKGKEYNLEVLVENHGHPSSNGAWLAMLMQLTDHENVGIYLDFDNFFMGGWNHNPQRRYDTRQGMEDLAPYTRGVSAKSYDFADDGSETTVDFKMCVQKVLDAGFRGWFCAEFEGEHLDEYEGTEKTVALLKKLRQELADDYK